MLFAGAFDNEVKNSPLAKAVVEQLPDARLMEMKGYTRQQVNWVMNGADCLLMTSFREGSPQVVKEAMTCGTPIVSVDVGDVRDQTSGIDGCYVGTYSAGDLAHNVRQAIAFKGKTQGPARIAARGLRNKDIAKHVLAIYEEVKDLQK